MLVTATEVSKVVVLTENGITCLETGRDATVLLLASLQCRMPWNSANLSFCLSTMTLVASDVPVGNPASFFSLYVYQSVRVNVVGTNTAAYIFVE